jgi:hypothetical protein
MTVRRLAAISRDRVAWVYPEPHKHEFALANHTIIEAELANPRFLVEVEAIAAVQTLHFRRPFIGGISLKSTKEYTNMPLLCNHKIRKPYLG